MVAYRKLRCQNCGDASETVCGAHSNWAIHGKGRGIKADDNRAASLCFWCHNMLDQGKDMTETEKRRMWWNAHRKTVEALVWFGYWPGDVPVPDISNFPKEWIE